MAALFPLAPLALANAALGWLPRITAAKSLASDSSRNKSANRVNRIPIPKQGSRLSTDWVEARFLQKLPSDSPS